MYPLTMHSKLVFFIGKKSSPMMFHSQKLWSDTLKIIFLSVANM